MVLAFHCLMHVVLEYFRHFFHLLAMKVHHLHRQYSYDIFHIIIFCFVAGAHMAEETRGASRAGKIQTHFVTLEITVGFFRKKY